MRFTMRSLTMAAAFMNCSQPGKFKRVLGLLGIVLAFLLAGCAASDEILYSSDCPASPVADQLRKSGLLRTQPVPDMPRLLETIFEPGAVEVLEAHASIQPLPEGFFDP